MRLVAVAGLLAMLCPAGVLAQTATAVPAPSPATAAPRHAADVGRDAYIDHAKRAAERRFDRMDGNHDGVLTADERRAWRETHTRRHPAAVKCPDEPGRS